MELGERPVQLEGSTLALVFFDYRCRQVGIERFLMLSGNREADMAEIASECGTRFGTRPQRAAPIRLKA